MSYVDELSLKLTAKDEMSSRLKRLRKELGDVEKAMSKARSELENTGSPEAAAELRKLEKQWVELTQAQAKNRKEQAANEAAMKKLRAQAELSQTTAAKLGRAWTKAANVFSNDLVAGMSAAALFMGGRKFLNAYAEAQTMQAQLDLAYQKFPASANMSIEALRAYSDELMRSTGADDDALAASQAMLMRFNLTATEIRTLTPLVNDLAMAKGIELTDAATAVGKAIQGQTRALKDIGIVYKSSGDASTDLANIQALLTEKVGGTADAFGQTEAGKMARLNAQYGNLTETIGQQLVPALDATVAVAEPVMKVFQSLPGPVQQTTVALGFLGTAALVVTPRIAHLNSVTLASQGGFVGLASKSKGVAVGLLAISAAYAAAAASGTAYRPFQDDFADAAGKVDALKTVMGRGNELEWFRDGFTEAIGILPGVEGRISSAKTAVGDFDRQLVDLVAQGKEDEAQALFFELSRGAAEWGASASDVKKELPGYTRAMEDAGAATRGTAADTDYAATANDRLRGSLTKLDKTLARRAALQGYQEALKSFIEKPSKQTADALLAATSDAAKSFVKPENAAKFTQSAIAAIGDAADDPSVGANLRSYLLNPLQDASDEARQLLWLLQQADSFTPSGQRVAGGTVTKGAYTGGLITGPGTGTSDSIPMMLSNGEYVVRAAAVRALGVDTLRAINNADRTRLPLPAAPAPRPVTPRVLVNAGARIGQMTTHVTAHGQVDYELAQRRTARKMLREARARGAGSRS